MNRLAASTSTYLREHAGNPVDWYPWGDEAFERARALDRPLLVSVGYAACHWCHVMARETFEDAAMAARLNQLVVSVKVDREERPDVDAVYMDAVQHLTGRGGWPMTVFCLPDGRPFHGGTYYPPRDQAGLPGFLRVLEAVATAWAERREAVVRAAEQLTQRIAPARLGGGGAAGTGDAELGRSLDQAAAGLLAARDPDHGGFGGAPKFPNAPALLFLLGHAAATARDDAPRPDPGGPAGAVGHALDAMAWGGIHDQVGGGFHRYAVDAAWRIPHFEKMLVDQALLASLYAHAARLPGRGGDRRVVADTVGHMVRDLAAPDGGFVTSTDADSGGGEGRFFVWTRGELEAALGGDEGAVAARVFGVDARGNFEDGTTVLHLPGRPDQVARELGTTTDRLLATIDGWRGPLLEARSRRPPPRRDEARLTGLNALAAAALLDAGAVLGEPDLHRRGLDTLEVLLQRARPRGSLVHVWHPGAPPVGATLSDAAALGLGLIRAHQATLEARWLEELAWVADAVLPRFRSRSGPGWFDTADDHDRWLPVRPRSLEDGAVPSGTALAALLALHAGALLGRADLLDEARTVLRALLPTAVRVPLAFGGLLQAVEAALAGPATVTVAGGTAPERAALIAVARERYRPHVLCLTRAADGSALDGTAPGPAPPSPGAGATAVVCRGTACALPTADPEVLRAELGSA